MRGELKELEAWFVDHGHLPRTGAKIGSYSRGSWFTDWGLLRHNTRIVVNQLEAVLPYFRPVVLGPRT